MEADYYAVLQITPAATFDQVHKAYRALAMIYHPDRNPAPGAGVTMAAINEAYMVLSDPSRRRDYDRERSPQTGDVAGPILRAARETLMAQGWIVTENNDSSIRLERDLRAVKVSFVARLDGAFFRKIVRQSTSFSVVLAVEIETPFNLSFTTAVIDLMRSKHYGAPFPDDVYRSLFSPFVP